MKRTPLFQVHTDLEARMVEFAGFEMPLQYTSIIQEHMTVREKVGLFDVSHMGNMYFEGKDTVPFMQRMFTNDAARSDLWEMKYTLMCNEKGQILDDMIFYKKGDDDFCVIPNAATTGMAFDWFKEHAEGDVAITDASNQMFVLALQGPKARKTLSKLTDFDVKSMKFFTFNFVDLGVGDKVMTCRSGYTGEDGFELVGPNDQAEDLWKRLMEAGAEFGIEPIGLGARDTLRMEKGFLLSGTDFNKDRTPLEAGVEWAMKWEHDFIGKDVLVKQKEDNGFDRFRGFLMVDRGIPRHGCIIEKDGKEVGTITSGTMSPVLQKGIGLGYIKKKYKKAGKDVDIVVRGKRLKAQVAKLPLVPNK